MKPFLSRAVALLGMMALMGLPPCDAADEVDVSGYKKIAVLPVTESGFELIRFGLTERKDDRYITIANWGLDDVFYDVIRGELEKNGSHTVSRLSPPPQAAARFSAIVARWDHYLFNDLQPVQQDVVDLGGICGCDAILLAIRREHPLRFLRIIFDALEPISGFGLYTFLDSGKGAMLYASYALVLVDIHSGQVLRSANGMSDTRTIDENAQGHLPQMRFYGELWPLDVPLDPPQIEKLRKRSGTLARETLPRALKDIGLLPPDPQPILRAPMH